MTLVLDDTIAAIATAPGEAGLAVVRVSGPEALAIAARVVSGAAIESAAGHTLHHGWIREGEARIEEVVAAVFRAPRSYTREDVVELSCHGGTLPARAVLAALLARGARHARPGEFTLRAFLNGRLDLVQAEAVAELIHARSESQQRAALARLAGGLSRELRAHLEQLADLVAEVEARVDFAEDVGGIEVPPAIVARMRALAQALAAHLCGAAWGRAMREGVQVAIAGKPNAGKSSLFNRLLGESRAIVTAVAGTTRDRVSASIEVEGALFTLSDTAGLREAEGEIEAIGIERTHEALAESRVVLWVRDGTQPFDAADAELADRLAGKAVVVALNKADLGAAVDEPRIRAALACAKTECVHVSAVRGDGLERLRHALAAIVGFTPGDVLASERQADLLARACAALDGAASVGEAGAPGEIVAIELRDALAALEEMLGLKVSDDLLDRIFGRFCIGK